MLLKQETSHLIIYLPMVSCTRNFVRVNIKNDSRRRNVEETADESVQPTNSAITATADGNGNRNNNNNTVSPLKIFIAIYKKILEPESWIYGVTYQRCINELLDMALCDFVGF